MFSWDDFEPALWLFDFTVHCNVSYFLPPQRREIKTTEKSMELRKMNQLSRKKTKAFIQMLLALVIDIF